MLLIIALLARYLHSRQKNNPVLLFAAARENENRGCYQEALTHYEAAFSAAQKSTYNRDLKNQIIGKIKVLHAVIRYQNNFT